MLNFFCFRSPSWPFLTFFDLFLFFLSFCRNRHLSCPEHIAGFERLWLWLLGNKYWWAGGPTAFPLFCQGGNSRGFKSLLRPSASEQEDSCTVFVFADLRSAVYWNNTGGWQYQSMFDTEWSWIRLLLFLFIDYLKWTQIMFLKTDNN